MQAFKFALRYSFATGMVVSVFLILPVWIFRAPYMSEGEVNAYILTVILLTILVIGLPAFIILFVFSLLKNKNSHGKTVIIDDAIDTTNQQSHDTNLDNIKSLQRQHLNIFFIKLTVFIIIITIIYLLYQFLF